MLYVILGAVIQFIVIALWSSNIFKLIFLAFCVISGNFLPEKHATEFEQEY
jgi:hypothetical protein